MTAIYNEIASTATTITPYQLSIPHGNATAASTTPLESMTAVNMNTESTMSLDDPTGIKQMYPMLSLAFMVVHSIHAMIIYNIHCVC